METPLPTYRERGSVLLITLTFIIILTIAAVSVLDLSSNAYQLSMRNQLRAEGRAVAESELEYLLYQFKSTVVAGNSAANAPSLLTTICDNATVPTTDRDPFLQIHHDQGWRVRRSLILDRGPIPGIIPGTTKTGDFTYVIARVEVLPPTTSPFAGSTASVRVGRRFINSNTSIFQYSVFFQGDLELNPGSDTIINGDVVANGSIYMGPSSGHTLTINGKVRYLADQYFNTTSGGAATYSNPNAPTPPVTLVAPTFAGGGQASQLETLAEPENLLGGIDATVTAKDRPDLFGPAGRTDSSAWTAAEQAQAENNVYRSLIVPPPAAANSNEYPNSATTDDAVIGVRRAYNRAGLIVTVETDGSVSVTKLDHGATSDVTSAFTSALSDFDPSPTVTTYTKDVYDEREAKTVKTTEIDVGALKTTLDTLRALPSSDPDHFDFNGLLYVNLKSSSSTAPAGVRLINATALPENGESGFALATNGGVYVKGNYNSTSIGTNDDGSPRYVPAMILADAVTVLSSSWTDSTTTRALSSRVASSGTTYINAGLLTGNMSSSGSASSGGVQNLVRYEEDWAGKSVSFLGSIGRLFQSTAFVAPYGGAGTIYNIPNRVFSFDTAMLTHRPPGSPETTAFSRGSFFTW
jgi:hypothetical protein